MAEGGSMWKRNARLSPEEAQKLNELVTSLVDSLSISYLENEARLLTLKLLAQPELIEKAIKRLEAACLKESNLVDLLTELVEQCDRPVLRLVLESTHNLPDNRLVRELARSTLCNDRRIDEATLCAADVLRRDEDCLTIVSNVFTIATSCGGPLSSYAQTLWEEGLCKRA